MLKFTLFSASHFKIKKQSVRNDQVGRQGNLEQKQQRKLVK